MWLLLKDLELEIPFDLAISLLCILPKDYNSFYYSGTVYNSKDLEPTQMPLMTDWTRKMWHIYTMEYYATIKKTVHLYPL